MKAYPVTHAGLVRQENEDTIRVVHGAHGLYILADGMGGHLAGEVASRMAADELEQMLTDGCEPSTERLREAIVQANAAVYEKQLSSPDMKGMGTTLTVVWESDVFVYVGHVGDSRAYLYREGMLRQMTEDHSLVGELVRAGAITEAKARTHPQRNVITRAVGTDEKMQPDVFRILKAKGDKWLLCSDGLTDMVEDQKILETIEKYDAAQAARQLVQLALEGGGKDNISVMLLEVEA